MKKETRKYITYLFPGSFFPESSTQRVDSFDVPSSIPSDCFSFSFSEVDIVVDGKNEYKGESRNIGKQYYIGKTIHVDDIVGEEYDILRTNVRNNSPTKRAIKTHLGNWQVETENCVILSESSVKFGKPMLYTKMKDKSKLT